MMTNTKVSIFNRYKEPFTNRVIYKKHVIEYAFWDDSIGINSNTGYENNDKVDLYIPFDKNADDLNDYIEQKKYNGNGWTIQNGDFIVKGDCIETEIEGIKELKQYEVFEITDVDIKDFGSYNMQHFEIRGK